MKKIYDFLKRLFSYIKIRRIQRYNRLKAQIKAEVMDEMREYVDNALQEAREKLLEEITTTMYHELKPSKKETTTPNQFMGMYYE